MKQKHLDTQEAMDSFAFPDRINPISTEIPQMCSKLYSFSLESLDDSPCGTFSQKGKGLNQ